ncbi:unnamed protein product [Bursaphelenchus okinawaensis]|uniref:peptide-methionine (S)-S-oxide reductase n=1 Tax=Bursaphelenchus okinawaensis TaxID=465554 RepID=A0A811K6G4_9BILA|nr:unnamed protein product [Bursaphelenchus okinawaensis]CAG9093928.1 unnamed protein product [Bursaphelenchus okinawaensis]
MQCFWGESAFAKIDGVLKTRVGYAGGKQSDPTYDNIKDHTEVTELVFDENVVKYDSLLDFFFSHHDPNARRKTQYRSVILYVDDEQKQQAEASLDKVKKRYPNPETTVEKLDKFYQAEDYHQKYWLRCQRDVHRALKLNDKELVDSVLAAKINAFLAGYDRYDVLNDLAAQHKLEPALVNKIEAIAKAGGDPRSCH